jgi:hypothetical protein
MDAAEQIVPAVELSELLPWAEICARYPDQYVCLVDVMKIEPHSPTIATAKVAGHGQTRRDASAIIRSDLRYTAWTVVFTGKPTRPLRRPPVFFD